MKSPRLQSGFTLVEMIVSIGIFIVVLMIASSAFLTVVNADRRTYATRVAIDNLTVTLEDMTRRVKTGHDYSVSGGTFSFTDQENRATEYKLGSSKIQRSIAGASFEDITPPEITITSLAFVVGGTTTGDAEQPYVRINISGTTGEGLAVLPFTLQTMVTQRKYDFQ